MASSEGSETKSAESNGQWEGYSDYQTVSASIARSIDEALSAYTELESMHMEGGKVKDMQAARARSKIKLAAMKLVPELDSDARNVEQYRQILCRWLGSGRVDFEVDGPEDGYFERLNDTRLSRECPDWLENWVLDIRTAGWELGYLRAGRQSEAEEDDPIEASARKMIEDILSSK